MNRLERSDILDSERIIAGFNPATTYFVAWMHVGLNTANDSIVTALLLVSQQISEQRMTTLWQGYLDDLDKQHYDIDPVTSARANVTLNSNDGTIAGWGKIGVHERNHSEESVKIFLEAEGVRFD